MSRLVKIHSTTERDPESKGEEYCSLIDGTRGGSRYPLFVKCRYVVGTYECSSDLLCTSRHTTTTPLTPFPVLLRAPAGRRSSGWSQTWTETEFRVSEKVGILGVHIISPHTDEGGVASSGRHCSGTCPGIQRGEVGSPT